MMTNAIIINLNKARKARDRKAARARADTNAVVHGLPKVERLRVELDRMRTETFLNGLRRDSATAPDEGGKV